MSKCTYCGRENPAGAGLCKGCGARLTDATSPPLPGDAEQAAQAPEPPLDSLDGSVLALLASGSKIDAIKLYREQTGVGLKEAKDAVEAVGRKHGVAPKQCGCAGVLLLVLLLGGAAMAVAF